MQVHSSSFSGRATGGIARRLGYRIDQAPGEVPDAVRSPSGLGLEYSMSRACPAVTGRTEAGWNGVCCAARNRSAARSQLAAIAGFAAVISADRIGTAAEAP